MTAIARYFPSTISPLDAGLVSRSSIVPFARSAAKARIESIGTMNAKNSANVENDCATTTSCRFHCSSS